MISKRKRSDLDNLNKLRNHLSNFVKNLREKFNRTKILTNLPNNSLSTFDFNR